MGVSGTRYVHPTTQGAASSVAIHYVPVLAKRVRSRVSVAGLAGPFGMFKGAGLSHMNFGEL